MTPSTVAARGLGDHARVGVQADHALEEMGEAQGDAARTATDVEQTATAVESEVACQRVGQGGGVGLATSAVVGGRALEDGLVPCPLLPAVALSLIGCHLVQALRARR